MPEDENWVDVGHTDEFSATPLKRVTAMNVTSQYHSRMESSARFRMSATMSVGRLATAGWMAIISSARGTIGNFTAAAE